MSNSIIITPEYAVELINDSALISDKMRLDLFAHLAQSFSLIPLRGGFPGPGEPANSYKAPIHSGWQRWCNEKRPFNRSDFAPERAGIACGPASGVIVLDVDSIWAFKLWCDDYGLPKQLPPTLTIQTGGKGERFHYYYLYPQDGKRYPCRSVKDCFDIRGTGGQVLCPGSLHPETKKPYVITEAREIAPAPPWLLEFSLTRTTPVTPPGSSHQDVDLEPEPFEHEIAEIGASPDPAQSQKDMTMTTPQQTPPLDINILPVSDEIKNLIQAAMPKGQRSEPSMRVLLALLGAGVPEQTIRAIYQHYPIGDKSRENQPDWFDREIQKAQEYILLVKPQGPPPANPFAPASPQAPSITYHAMSALDIVNAQVNFSFLIENFWPKDEPLLITGPGGAGKSLITLQIAMDLIHPTPPKFLDNFTIYRQHRVLFVQSENSIVSIKRRLNIIRQHFQIDDQILRERMIFLGIGKDIRAVGDMTKSTFTDTIKHFIDFYKSDLVIIDPLISFHSMDENSNDQMRRLLDSVAIFCEDSGVTPLLIHHHAKMTADSGPGGGRGASAIGDWSPNTWELSFNSKNKSYTLKHRKARNFQLQDHLDLSLNYLRFTSKACQAIQTTSQYVVQALQSLGGNASSKGDLVKALKQIAVNAQGISISDNTARKYIDTAVKEGVVTETPVPGKQNKIYKLN